MNLNMTRVFNAPAELVFKAWTDAEAITKWFSPSGTWSVSVVKMDVRAGGQYRFELRSPENQSWTVWGQYHEVVANQLIVFTWCTEDVTDTVVTVGFRDLGGTTEVSLSHDLLPNQEQVDEHKWGWDGCMENLAAKILQ